VSKYLIFEYPPGKLPMSVGILVKSKKHGIVLGRIEYYLAWQQFVFVPNNGTAWSWECLADIEAELQKLNNHER